MDEERQLAKKRCAAMINEGIYDPESKDGIDFCVNCCPYDYCVVMEQTKTKTQLIKEKKADLAKKLRRHRVSVEDIALILHSSKRNIHRWLKQ